MTTLMNERASIGAGSGGAAGCSRPAHARDARALRSGRRPGRPDEATQVYIRTIVAKWNNQRALDKIRRVGCPAPSVDREAVPDPQPAGLHRMGLEGLGPRMIADSGEWGMYAFPKMFMGVPGMRVAGGTDEIMHNIVAERCSGCRRTPGSTRRRRSVSSM